MGLRINGSTSGYVELNAPAVAGTTNLTLPTLGFGKVLQVVQSTTNTLTDSSSNVYIDTTLSGTITPIASSSKILIFVSQTGIFKGVGSTANGMSLRLVRGSTEILFAGDFIGYNNVNAELYSSPVSITYLDSPNTTAATTYKTQFKSSGNTSYVRVQQNSSTSTIIMIEIAA